MHFWYHVAIGFLLSVIPSSTSELDDLTLKRLKIQALLTDFRPPYPLSTEARSDWSPFPMNDERIEIDSEWLNRVAAVLENFHNGEKGLKALTESIQRLQKVLAKAEGSAEEPTEDPDAENLANCLVDVLYTLDQAGKGEFWAMQVLDSWGTRESGSLVGNFNWYGTFFECEEAGGQWCDIYMGDQYTPARNGLPLGQSIGACFAPVCNQRSVEILFAFLTGTNDTAYPTYFATCPERPDKFLAGDIIGIIITSIFLALVVAATILDIIHVELEKWRASQSGTEATDETHHEAPRIVKRSVGVKMLLSFSAYTNTKKILDMTKRKDNMTVLDGLRFLTMSWVIMGHSFFHPLFNIDNARQANIYVLDHPGFQAVANATFAVDTFFCLGGFLVALLTLKELKKTGGKINIPMAYLHRYIRLTPAYAYCILFVVSIYRWMGTGPFYNTAANYYHDGCQEAWYANLLYFSNLYPASDTCIAWTWYLPNDMQFYLLSPFLLILLYRWRYVGIAVLTTLLTGSIATTGGLARWHEQQPNVVGGVISTSFLGWFYNYSAPLTIQTVYEYDIYSKPWTRIGAYVVGMMAGYIIYETKGKIRMPAWAALIGWIIAAGSALSIIYGLSGVLMDRRVLDVDVAAFYLAVTRPIWAACVSWVIIACLAGYGGPVTAFLSWKVFVPLSRLCYCAYLVHPLVIVYYVSTQETEWHFLMGTYIYFYLGAIVMSFACAYVLSIVVEGPMIGVEKHLFQMLARPRGIASAKDESTDTSKETASPPHNTVKRPLENGVEVEIVFDNKSFATEL